MKTYNDWIIFTRDEYPKIRDKVKFEKWLSVCLNSSFFECACTLDKPFYEVKTLRHVLAPYVKDGKPRGWFKGSNGEPLRWTGVGNIVCLDGDKAEEALYALLDALSRGIADSRFMTKQDGFIGFAPTKLSLV